MLPKTNRLNLNKSFSWVSSGKRTETEHFVLKMRAGQNTTALVGIALSGKNFKKSHDRNRAKRLTSQAIQVLYPGLPKDLNLVIMPKAAVLNAQVDSLTEELKKALKNI